MPEKVIRGDGVVEWRDDEGRLDRPDRPARIFPGGRREWFRRSKRHREGAPACVYVNGTGKWYRHGKRHRDGGPAARYPDGRRIWFKDGVKVREEHEAS